MPANITVTAPSASGAVVTYAAAASDLVDGAVTPTCSRASGSTFPIGDTTVSCTARDAHNNASAAKTFNVHVNAPGDTTAASCGVTATVTADGKKYADMTVQDTGSGLASIQVIKSINATTPVPAFTAGTKNAVIVRATKVNQSASSTFELRVTDVAGNTIDCDPTSVSLRIKSRGGSMTQRMTRIPAKEHWLRIDNERPGLSKLEVRVNGKRFRIVRPRAGKTIVLDLARCMRTGHITITVKGSAHGRGAASVLIHD